MDWLFSNTSLLLCDKSSDPNPRDPTSIPEFQLYLLAIWSGIFDIGLHNSYLPMVLHP